MAKLVTSSPWKRENVGSNPTYPTWRLLLIHRRVLWNRPKRRIKIGSIEQLVAQQTVNLWLTHWGFESLYSHKNKRVGMQTVEVVGL